MDKLIQAGGVCDYFIAGVRAMGKMVDFDVAHTRNKIAITSGTLASEVQSSLTYGQIFYQYNLAISHRKRIMKP